MEKYKVEWCESAVSAKTNKSYKKLALLGEKGDKHNVNIFSDFPDYANIGPGSVVLGTLEKNGQYENIRYASEKPRGGASGGFKQAQIKEVMAQKEESIGKFQDKKEESIRLMAAQRDAVLIVTTMMSQYPEGTTESDVKTDIIKWRNWFLNDEDFNNPPPF